MQTMPSRGQQPDPTEARHRGVEMGQDKKKRAPDCYPSNAADTPIVHAATGDALGAKVGSAASLVLFRVTDATGLYDETGYRASRRPQGTDDTVGKTPNQFYYRTPSEFEAHWGQPAPAAVIDAWTERVDRLFPEAELNEAEWEKYRSEDPTRIRGRGVRSTAQVC